MGGCAEIQNRDPYIIHLNIALYMVGSLYFGGKSHVSNGQSVSFKEPCKTLFISSWEVVQKFVSLRACSWKSAAPGPKAGHDVHVRVGSRNFDVRKRTKTDCTRSTPAENLLARELQTLAHRTCSDILTQRHLLRKLAQRNLLRKLAQSHLPDNLCEQTCSESLLAQRNVPQETR